MLSRPSPLRFELFDPRLLIFGPVLARILLNQSVPVLPNINRVQQVLDTDLEQAPVGVVHEVMRTSLGKKVHHF